MSLTSRIQDQKDHITQAKKDLCSKVGIPSEPLPRIIITVFFKIQLAIKYTYWHGMKIAKGIKTLAPCIQIMLLQVVI